MKGPEGAAGGSSPRSLETLRVLLGVTGGIAAFKAPELVRRLTERGHEVRCALTRSATSFVTPLTLEVLTEYPVYREEYLQANDSGEELHLTAAGWADVLCVAPATCNTLARLALGLCDDFLTTTAIAFDGPVVVAPAMDSVMWRQPVVQRNVETLRSRGVRFAGPVVGRLASGKTGIGRMAEPAVVVDAIETTRREKDMLGRTVLVTAGPTREPLDPVRYLSNRSSGRMGFALAGEAAARGARTLLVSGPVELGTPAGVERIDVTTAEEMQAAVSRWGPQADLILMNAAVTDFRPRTVSQSKLKKRDGLERIDLEPNPDILSSLALVAPQAVRVGFAAETEQVERQARTKLETKDVHFMVANDVSRSEIGFDSEENEVTVFAHAREPLALKRQPKWRLATRLLDLFTEELEGRDRGTVAARR